LNILLISKINRNAITDKKNQNSLLNTKLFITKLFKINGLIVIENGQTVNWL